MAIQLPIGGYLPLTGGTLTGELITLASATGTAGFNVPHGTAPTSPVNGDMWTTTTGLFARINGTTQQYAPLASPTFTGTINGASAAFTGSLTAGSGGIGVASGAIGLNQNATGDITSLSTGRIGFVSGSNANLAPDTYFTRAGANVMQCSGQLYATAATPFGTKTTATNGSGAGAGTLTNAPTAGNPTKWVPFDDNGTTRYIPMW